MSKSKKKVTPPPAPGKPWGFEFDPKLREKEKNRALADPVGRAIELLFSQKQLPLEVMEKLKARTLTRAEAADALRAAVYSDQIKAKAAFDANLDKSLGR